MSQSVGGEKVSSGIIGVVKGSADFWWNLAVVVLVFFRRDEAAAGRRWPALAGAGRRCTLTLPLDQGGAVR